MTIYSGYAHLSEMLVREGDFVRKDEVIAKSGDTGMATAPHLHFQIDRSSAPFHPYWPFDWDDVKAAGVGSYFEAVKHGVGKSRGLQHTLHPIEYISQYQNFEEPPQLIASSIIPEEVIITQPEPEVIPEPVVETPPEEVVITGDLDLIFQTDRKFVPGQEALVKVRVNDSRLVATAGIAIDSTLGRLAEIYPKNLKASDFQNNVAEVRVKTDSDNTFKLIAKGNFGEKKSSSLRAQVFLDVETTHKYAPAIAYLRRNDIVKGYDDGSFKPDGILNRAEAVKILLTANDIQAGAFDTEFIDVPDNAWFAPYVATAFKKEIVKGYSDGSFKPGNTITRAEFIKVAIATGGFPTSEVTRNPYPDVEKTAWFAPYFQFAQQHNLIEAKRGGFMTPHQPITRAEAAHVMYQLADVRLLAKGE